MRNTDYREPPGHSFTEHLVFVALLLPTFVVLAAAVVSLAPPEGMMAVEYPILTAAACDACPAPDADEGP